MKQPSPASVASRRSFLTQATKLGVFCGLGCLCAQSGLKLYGADGMGAGMAVPDPKKLNFCGYTCPGDCPMKAAGLSNDVEQKRKAYDMWRLKERYGLEFEPDKILCNGCKTDKRELGMAVSNCPVRKCAVEKGLDCCIECDELTSCDKALWTEFPDFHKYVMGMQTAYMDSLK